MRVSYISTLGMNRERWLAARRIGIGGSDAAVIIGLNEFKSRYELWADKVGYDLPQKETEALRIGTDLEDYVAKRFEEATGKKVRREHKMFFNSDFPYALADIDRKIVGENAGLECKTTSAYNKEIFEDGDIPPYYYVQCQHYMAVRGFERMYLAVLVLGVGFYWFVIDRNDAEIAALMEAEEDFWESNVLAKKEPDPDGSENCGKAVSYLTSSQSEELHESLVDMKERLDRREALKSMIDTLEQEKSQIEQEIKLRLDTATEGDVDGYKVTYRQQMRTSIDSKRLLQDLPDVYQKYSKDTASRILRITKKKEKKS